MPEAERYQREADFHDRTFEQHSRATVQRFYTITGASRRVYRDLITSTCAGQAVLEYGCGPGSYAFDLAERGARVIGIDISPVAIELARNSASERGLDIRFSVMNAESLDLPDGSFDIVCGTGILHHLDLARGIVEVRRVLKVGGRAVFLEPLGHNPIINWYRRRTPQLRSVDEHPLRMDDLALIGRHFDHMTVRMFHLTTLAAVPLRKAPGFPAIVSALDVIDRRLFGLLPSLRKHAWSCLIEVS